LPGTELGSKKQKCNLCDPDWRKKNREGRKKDLVGQRAMQNESQSSERGKSTTPDGEFPKMSSEKAQRRLEWGGGLPLRKNLMSLNCHRKG